MSCSHAHNKPEHQQKLLSLIVLISKTAFILSTVLSLRDLFPCGDSMVCIIDDREDVWKFAPNLITVKKYVYFQGIGDINAPPGSREIQMKKKGNYIVFKLLLQPFPLFKCG